MTRLEVDSHTWPSWHCGCVSCAGHSACESGGDSLACNSRGHGCVSVTGLSACGLACRSTNGGCVSFSGHSAWESGGDSPACRSGRLNHQ